MGFRRGFKSEAERIALELRSKIGSLPTAPLEIETLCSEFDIDLIRMSELDCDCTPFQGRDSAGRFSAMMVPRGIGLAIVHNDSHHKHRQRSNICHELAHTFLGHKACTLMNEDGSRTHDREIEDEASFLGGALLLPKPAALHILKTGMKARARDLYGISSKMLEYRLRVSGAQIIYDRSRTRLLAS